MIDVNMITDLLIQHSQSTGFEKSLEMLTQTLRQLTDPNTISLPGAPTASALSQPASQAAQSNPFENLLMKRLQPPIPPPGPPPVAAPPMWFNPAAAVAPPFYPPANPSIDFPSPQQYPNQRN